jgi:hypothetical protein
MPTQNVPVFTTQVITIHILIRTPLLNNKYRTAKLKNGVQLLCIELCMVEILPVNHSLPLCCDNLNTLPY